MFHFFITKCTCFWPLSRMANFSVVFLFLTVFKVASLCAHSPNLNDVLFNGNYEFIDMTYPFDDSTIYWPNTKHFELTERNHSFHNAGSWYAANNYAAAEHGGTHFDAPYHFQVNGKQVGEIPLDKLILPLIIIDISSKVNDDPNFVLYKHHLDFMVNDNFGKPCIIIFKFGWSKFINDRVKYLGLDKNNNLNFPGLSEEVAEWITSSYKNVIGVGVDTSSIDVGSTTNFPAHKILSKAGLYNLENVKLDRHVPEHGCTALVMPMKIAKGTGAPLRLVAICPNNQANF